MAMEELRLFRSNFVSNVSAFIPYESTFVVLGLLSSGTKEGLKPKDSKCKTVALKSPPCHPASPVTSSCFPALSEKQLPHCSQFLLLLCSLPPHFLTFFCLLLLTKQNYSEF